MQLLDKWFTVSGSQDRLRTVQCGAGRATPVDKQLYNSGAEVLDGGHQVSTNLDTNFCAKTFPKLSQSVDSICPRVPTEEARKAGP
ncbi:hypothetical protein GCM10023350_13110 [Nocardioides endophyticus]|uniref:Uncharacterized protein n=1 Tax=Nocardioides endophyticus TaxID=1353775 RepID=A0ABP8YLJ3_9ACTN